MTPEEPTRLIRVSVELLDSLGSRTFDGRAITAEWGEPVGSCGVEPGLIFDIYEPTFTTTDDGYSLVPTAEFDRLRAVERAVWTNWASRNIDREARWTALIVAAGACAECFHVHGLDDCWANVGGPSPEPCGCRAALGGRAAESGYPTHVDDAPPGHREAGGRAAEEGR